VLGVAASTVELGLLGVLVSVLMVSMPIASATAAEALILVKFAIADRFIFGHSRPRWDRLLKYHGACLGALIVYWLVINGLVALADVPYVIGFIVGTGASLGWSLATNFLWVWRSAAAR
jgi:putative flippase GtrA